LWQLWDWQTDYVRWQIPAQKELMLHWFSQYAAWLRSEL
jgi:hypothetical protein